MKLPRTFRRMLGICTAFILLPAGASASLVGDEILVEQFTPTITTPCALGTNSWSFTVTDGVSDTFTSCGDGVDVNVQGNSVLITKNNSATFGAADFSGFVFSSLDWLPNNRIAGRCHQHDVGDYSGCRYRGAFGQFFQP